MSIGNICNREVIVTGESTSLVEVAKLMRDYHVGSVIVVERSDGIRPIGIVTDRDLVVGILAEGLDPARVALADIMTRALVTSREDEEVYETIELMRSRGVRRVPVVDPDGNLSGVVSVDDMLWSLAQELRNIVALVERQPADEVRRRTHP